MILKQPVLTEKSIGEYENANKVTFEVSLDATKLTAKKALEEVYGVKVINVWANNRLGKTKLHPKRRVPVLKRRNKKIFTFQLDKDSKLDIFKG